MNETILADQTVHRTKKRFLILFLVFINVVINYMDRANISLAAPLLGQDLSLTPVQMGLIFSAFGWSYALLQIPGGWLVDRVKPRFIYTFILLFWSLATCSQSIAKGFSTLFGIRMGMGVLEAPSFPINNRVVTSWFPEQERATSIAFYTSGQFVGLAFLTPILMYIQNSLGWRTMLLFTGIIGVIWSIVWYMFYRDPKDSKANKAELDYIRQGGGLVDGVDSKEKHNQNANRAQLAYVLKNRKIWGVFLAQFCIASTLWFFLTWFPTYLVTYRGMAFIKAGFLASLPFVAAYIGVLCSGYISDWFIKHGHSVGFARKIPVITGLLLSTSIIGANYVQDPSMVIFYMTLAFFGNGLASITWVFVSALAPSNLLGITGGIFNFMGNLSSIAIPIIIGYLASSGSFEFALLFIGALALLGALSYIFLVGKVERIILPNN